MNQKIRVRIAPSPTGFAHVGTGYTALFNYAFARHNNGTFVVRIEDSDVKRQVEGAEDAIFEGLSWLGLDWDEGINRDGDYGPYRLSDRMDLYKQKAQELLDRGLAYEDEGAIRFKNPGTDVSWVDAVRGEITFPGDQITDFVIVKSDGFPVYNFGVVVDDIAMEISHVIRGEDHISNTPRQIALYKAIGANPPVFAHHPTLRNANHKKLSKRTDPVNLKLYQEQGYLPEALLNFFALQGWSHPEEKEIFDLEEFVKLFTLERVRQSGPIFDVNKLDWMNGQYIQKKSDEQLAELLSPYLSIPKEMMIKLAPLVKERIKKLSDIKELAGFLAEKPEEIDTSLFTQNYKEHLKEAIECVERSEWTNEALTESFLSRVKSVGFKTGDFFMDLRIAISGKAFTPPITESIVLLGKDETLIRLNSI